MATLARPLHTRGFGPSPGGTEEQSPGTPGSGQPLRWAAGHALSKAKASPLCDAGNGLFLLLNPRNPFSPTKTNPASLFPLRTECPWATRGCQHCPGTQPRDWATEVTVRLQHCRATGEEQPGPEPCLTAPARAQRHVQQHAAARHGSARSTAEGRAGEKCGKPRDCEIPWEAVPRLPGRG